MMRKPYFWILAAVFSAPLLFHLTLKPTLRQALEDTRPIFLAEPLEAIQGAQAGDRVARQLQLEDVSYEVVRGDSWWSIAKRFRIRDVSALTEFNRNIALVPGARITIPAKLLEPEP